MINFVELVNQVARVAKPAWPDFNGVKTMNDTLKEAGLDSLDWLIVMIYLCEIYGIPEAIGKEFKMGVKEFSIPRYEIEDELDTDLETEIDLEDEQYGQESTISELVQQ
jgi:hypothetical protein